MVDLRTLIPQGDIKERYTEHDWDIWLDDAIGTSQLQAFLVRYAEVEHMFIFTPAWRNVTNTCMDGLIQGLRAGVIKPVPATKSRVGCATCGDIMYVPSPYPRDYLKMRCNLCSDFDSNVTPNLSTLYARFGGLLDAD